MWRYWLVHLAGRKSSVQDLVYMKVSWTLGDDAWKKMGGLKWDFKFQPIFFHVLSLVSISYLVVPTPCSQKPKQKTEQQRNWNPTNFWRNDDRELVTVLYGFALRNWETDWIVIYYWVDTWQKKCQFCTVTIQKCFFTTSLGMQFTLFGTC